jgi:site-specific DNA-methyltransferase (adenine-specific)
MLQINKIHQGDCMELMQHIPDKSVDMVLCDLPYGTTACEWDKVLPLDELWKQYKRILKEDGVVVLTASQPFTTDLINSNRDWFRYCWIWDKVLHSNPLIGNIQPLRVHEDIVVFYKRQPTYIPQKTQGKKRVAGKNHESETKGKTTIIANGNELGLNNPTTIITFSNANKKGITHPTQKPVPLFRYLIKTYTNEGELVLDNCIGSGTTAVACKQTNRNFIGIELNQEYVDIANQRLKQDNLHAFFQTQGVLTEPSPNRNLKDLSEDKSQISANAETSLNSDIKCNNGVCLQ